MAALFIETVFFSSHKMSLDPEEAMGRGSSSIIACSWSLRSSVKTGLKMSLVRFIATRKSVKLDCFRLFLSS